MFRRLFLSLAPLVAVLVALIKRLIANSPESVYERIAFDALIETTQYWRKGLLT